MMRKGEMRKGRKGERVFVVLNFISLRNGQFVKQTKIKNFFHLTF